MVLSLVLVGCSYLQPDPPSLVTRIDCRTAEPATCDHIIALLERQIQGAVSVTFGFPPEPLFGGDLALGVTVDHGPGRPPVVFVCGSMVMDDTIHCGKYRGG